MDNVLAEIMLGKLVVQIILFYESHNGKYIKKKKKRETKIGKFINHFYDGNLLLAYWA